MLSSWTETIVAALRAQGVDPAPVLARAGFKQDCFRDPNARHPIVATARLWKLAAEEVGDPAFGLRVPKYVRYTTFHALGYAVFASSTLGDALARIVRFCQVVVDAGLLELRLHDQSAELCIVARPEHDLGGEALRDSILAIVVRACRAMTGGTFALQHVELRRPRGTPLGAYERFFSCPVEIGGRDALRFSREQLSLALPAGNAELARFSDAALRDYLGRLEAQTTVSRARAIIAKQLSGNVSPDSVARQLGMSRRTMQRSLRAHDTSYEDVLTSLRRELAGRYLREGRYAHKEVAFLLGYQSDTAFARAFRRWTGLTPSEYIARARDADP